jgi:hypothetical protein
MFQFFLDYQMLLLGWNNTTYKVTHSKDKVSVLLFKLPPLFVCELFKEAAPVLPEDVLRLTLP